MDLATERFWEHATWGPTDECWLWSGRTDHAGYGTFSAAGQRFRAHRFAYELFFGLIPDGLYIDHLCRVPSCVNPVHLEPVTNGENVLRGVGVTAQNKAKTHCPEGHEYTPENTYVAPKRPNERICLTCKKTRLREWQQRNRVAS